MKTWLCNQKFNVERRVNDFLSEERGDTNIIAIILLIIVVIALVAVFRTQMTNIVNGLFNQIKSTLGI